VPLVWHKANRRSSVVVVETSRLLELAREIVRASTASKTGTQSVQRD
jgi:hypothetical protein